MSLEILTDAIKKMAKISFEYNKTGKVSGTRFGDPHAVFIMRRKDNTESTKVDIFQTGGASDTGQELPGWRMFDLSELTDIRILSPIERFHVAEGYKPDSERYRYVIAKV